MSARVSVLALIVMASGGMAGGALAQSATPAEIPPESYDGVQYIDSEGCMFIRAGHGGRANWVPRVDPDRNHICGQTPTFAPQTAPDEAPEAQEAQLEEPAEPAPQPEDTASAEVAVAAERTAPSLPAAERRMAQQDPEPEPPAQRDPDPATPRVVGVSPEGPSLNPACPDHAPYGQRVALADGRNGIRCTADGPDPQDEADSPRMAARGAAGAGHAATVAPEHDAGAAVASPRVVSVPVARITRDARCPDHAPYGQRVILEGDRAGIRCVPDRLVAQAVSGVQSQAVQRSVRTDHVAPSRQTAAVRATQQKSAMRGIPEGYKPAWEDDRLNPHRAQGTRAGEAQMRAVWTDTVPRQLVTPQAGGTHASQAERPRRPDGAAQGDDAQRDERGTQVAARSGSGSLIQVGTYGVPDNARNVARQMERMGYPVRSRSVGGGLEVVMAGPFSDDATTRRALNTLRGAGFADAFVR